MVQIKRRIHFQAKTHHPPKQKLWEQVLWPPEVSWGPDLTHQLEGLIFDLKMTQSWSHRTCTMHLPRRAWSSNPLQTLQCQRGGRTSARSGPKILEILYSTFFQTVIYLGSLLFHFSLMVLTTFKSRYCFGLCCPVVIAFLHVHTVQYSSAHSTSCENSSSTIVL